MCRRLAKLTLLAVLLLAFEAEQKVDADDFPLDAPEIMALMAELNANAEGAIWQNGLYGYFERNASASLTPRGEIEIAYDQCIVWGPDVGNDPDKAMSHCGTGHFKWQKTRVSIDLKLVDHSETKIVSGEARNAEVGRRVAFNCANRLMGCALQVEGVEGKAPFGLLCSDWRACGVSAAHITRLIEIAKHRN